MLSIHQDFVFPSAAERKKHIDHAVRCIEIAARMGIPCIRLNSGRWKTVPSFDELMKVKGNEPPLPGHGLSDAIAWCVDSIRQCLPVAEREGVMLALENHWGLTTSVDTLLEIHRTVGSPRLGSILTPATFPTIRMRASRSWRRMRTSFRPRRTLAEAFGIHSISTTSGLPPVCAKPDFAGGCPLKWKGTKRPNRGAEEFRGTPHGLP